ncbi:hypothetical protein SPRG_07299 [Saprolegnia parasitica CBS 223.65]|uniref:Rab-GAP TBC domain-containing protein n=1 Tax=Saprolegnia parasitica (strain CBS 223.65) TaxID=695850 RepID=A0A067CAA8_SAPPC|nr:hypothetical protein SPRG_07299 [Saprolegnia parasitica CBS 223.65]KDO27669.1 hypothetical protein SPRG_07299 [Saprolegnia parasitica CBS 223.65]|eukprot:XP_012201481.1 hypothetical protein SPRG_07299 [Saprolegnia parasitica CBS 223.65]
MKDFSAVLDRFKTGGGSSPPKLPAPLRSAHETPSFFGLLTPVVSPPKQAAPSSSPSAFDAEYVGFHRERWLQQSGAAAKAASFPSSHYANLHHHSYASKTKDVNVQQIDRDIERTMLYDTASVEQRRLGLATASCRPANVPMLRRVLVAASWHLTTVGYCQSMDILCAFLLQYLDEEDAFWMLVTLVDDILPGYYTPTLDGIQVDQRVFQELVHEYLPELSAHLESQHAGVSLLCFHWFLCLYVNVLPTHVTELVWSCLFEWGPRALFEMGLRILTIAEADLLACDNSVELLETLQDVAVQINSSIVLPVYEGVLLKRDGKEGLSMSPIPSPSPLARLQKHATWTVRKAFEFHISAPFVAALRSHYAMAHRHRDEVVPPEPSSFAGLPLAPETPQWPTPASAKFQAVRASVASFTRVAADVAPSPSVLCSPRHQVVKPTRSQYELSLPRALRSTSPPNHHRLGSRAHSLPERHPVRNEAGFGLNDLKALHGSILDRLLDDQKNRWRWERQNAKNEWVGYSALSGAILEGSQKGNVSHVTLCEDRIDTYGSFSLPEATQVLVDLHQMVEQCEVSGRVSKVRRVRGLEDTSVYDVPLDVQTIQRVWGHCASHVQQAWEPTAVRDMLMALMQPNDTILLRDIGIGLAIACTGPPKDRLEFVLGLFDCFPTHDESAVIEVVGALYQCFNVSPME